jgi:hypothetical protein
MHPYSTNSEERFEVPLFLAVIAIAVAWALTKLFNGRLPFFVEVPGTVTLYAILLAIFRHYVWKTAVLRHLKIIKVPNLEGKWVGYLTSSFDEGAQQTPVTVDITQNWTDMFIKLTVPQSGSRSTVGSIYVSDAEAVLSYQYKNEPNFEALGTMHAHEGAATLEVGGDCTTLVGNYYSGRDRANHGKLVLKLVNDQLTQKREA